jgi:membrane protein implicated in regulation of membrane protease activity
MDGIYTFFLSMNWWQWLSFSVALLSVELMFPGIFMLWFGIGGLITTLIVFIFNVSGPFPVILFLILGLLNSILGYNYQKNRKIQLVNNLEKNFIGRTIVLQFAIENGVGREKIDNSYWTLKGPDLAKGEKVTITGVEGNSLIVNKA